MGENKTKPTAASVETMSPQRPMSRRVLTEETVASCIHERLESNENAPGAPSRRDLLLAGVTARYELPSHLNFMR